MSEEKKVTTDELHNLAEDLDKIFGGEDNSENFLREFAALFSLPDEEFDVLAPGLIQATQQTLNNPNNKLLLTQAYNAEGVKAEDLQEGFNSILEAIEKESDFSQTKKDFLKEFFGSIVSTISSTEGIGKKTIQIPIELCHPDAKIPQYAHTTDSGMDVYALDDIVVKPGQTVLVPTGIKVALPPGYELQVRPKSGRALKTKLRVANTPGTIDQGYRDEIKVIIENVDPPIRGIRTADWDGSNMTAHVCYSDIDFGQDYVIGKGEKFAQLVLCEVPKAAFYRVDNVKDIGEDRNGGFGSTGLV